MNEFSKLADRERTTFPKGLARLIVYEIMSIDFLHFRRLFPDSDDDTDSTPLSKDRLRPSNYDYAWVKVPYGANWWSPKKVRQHVEKKVRVPKSSLVVFEISYLQHSGRRDYSCSTSRHTSACHNMQWKHGRVFGALLRYRCKYEFIVTYFSSDINYSNYFCCRTRMKTWME